MPNFTVTVQKKYTQSGTIVVSADNAETAMKKIVDAMHNHETPLQTTDTRITWGPKQYDDFSFIVTGDVDKASDKEQEPEPFEQV